jgi:hypothetical protein
MVDGIKRARGEAIEEHRVARRDPRAEPESVRPKADDAQPTKTPPESEMRRAVPRLSPLPSSGDDFGAGSVPRPFESGPTLEGAGAAGTAPLRRQIAALQMELSVARAELASEQEGRANDAERMGTLLDRISGDDAVVQSLRDDLARERAFVEELRVSVQEKYADCNALRQRLAEVEESLTAKELDEAAERHVQTQRADRAEQEAAELKKQLEALRRDHSAREAELEKTHQALKTANIKAFAANRQLESWKSESFRMIEQTRAEHATTLEALRCEAAIGLAAAVKSLETIQTAILIPAPKVEAPAAPPPKLQPAPPPPAAHLPVTPTRPAIPALLRKKQPASTPSLEVAELDVNADDLIEELMSKGD